MLTNESRLNEMISLINQLEFLVKEMDLSEDNKRYLIHPLSEFEQYVFCYLEEELDNE